MKANEFEDFKFHPAITASPDLNPFAIINATAEPFQCFMISVSCHGSDVKFFKWVTKKELIGEMSLEVSWLIEHGDSAQRGLYFSGIVQVYFSGIVQVSFKSEFSLNDDIMTGLK